MFQQLKVDILQIFTGKEVSSVAHKIWKRFLFLEMILNCAKRLLCGDKTCFVWVWKQPPQECVCCGYLVHFHCGLSSLLKILVLWIFVSLTQHFNTIYYLKAKFMQSICQVFAFNTVMEQCIVI